MPKDAYEMSEIEMRSRIITLALAVTSASTSPFIENYSRDYLTEPALSLRGSVVTNKRFEDGTPFDSQGVGTSDLDVTLVGRK
jgi:hypothetical protein